MPTTTKPISSMSSEELLEHLKELKVELFQLSGVAWYKGQIATSNDLEGAYQNTRKAIACWNHAITW